MTVCLDIAVNVEAFLDTEGVLLDVRSPAEFAQGSLPEAFNLPLFSNEERAQIGTLYKQQGRDIAVLEGLRLVGPRLSQMVETASQLVGRKLAKVYCWRGGMRSGAVAWLLETAGIKTATLRGGYKSFRRVVCTPFSIPSLRVLGGLTGCGKSEILRALAELGEQVLDLEQLASHRGSAYGALGLAPQPTNEHFENLLASQLRRFDLSRPIWVEDESRLIGRCKVPDTLFVSMRAAPLWIVERSPEERVAHLLSIYGNSSPHLLREATLRLSKRLGGERVKAVLSAIDRDDPAVAVRVLLDYYDRTYSFSLKGRTGPRYLLAENGLSARQWCQKILAAV